MALQLRISGLHHEVLKQHLLTTEQRVQAKAQIIGLNNLQIHKTVYTITTDNNKLL